MTMKKLALLTFICTLAVVAVPAVGNAGTQPDPNFHDKVLGKVGGLRYATDSMVYGTNGFIDLDAGCGGPAWHLFGGGSNAGGPANQSFVPAERPDDYTDADSILDDGWFSNGFGPQSARLHSYSVCIRHALSYRAADVPDGSSANRTGSISCPGAKHVSIGSMFIGSSNSWETSSYPYDGPDKDKIPDDGWRGLVHDGVGGIGGFSVYAICSSGLKLHYFKSSTAVVKVNSLESVRVPCAADQHVVGGGERLTGSTLMGHVVASFPYDGPDNDKIPDDGWQAKVYNLGGSAKQLTGWAICLG